MNVPTEALEAVELDHRAEMARMTMQLVIYREKLMEHGIEPPESDADELLDLYRRCSAVISTASEFASSLGSAKEMMQDWARP